MKCRNWQVDAHSVLAPGQPCRAPDDASRITSVSALCSPTFQLPRKCTSSSTGLCEHSEPVRAHRPSQSLKQWGARARNLLRRTRDNSELTILKKHRTTFLFRTIKASSQIFYNCRKDSQYKSKGKEKPPKDLKRLMHLSSFISPALTDLL